MRIQFVPSLLTAQAWHWFHRMGGPGLILLALVDNSVIPLPGSTDAVVVLLSAYQRNLWPYYGFMATVGAVLGGFLTYRLGEKGEEETLEKKIGKKRAQGLYNRFRKRGLFTLAIGCVLPPPFPMTPVLVAAGAMHYPRKKFFSSISIGRAIRYLGLAYLGHAYGKGIIASLSKYYQPVLYGLIALAALASIGALLYFKWYRPKRQREERARGEEVEEFPLPHRKRNEAHTEGTPRK